MSSVYGIKSEIEGSFNGGVNTYESDVSSATAQSNTATAERIAKIRNASKRAKDRIDDSERRAIGKIVQMPGPAQDQLTNVWVEAACTFSQLIENILGSVVRMILNFLAGIVRAISNFFTGARNLLRRIFSF